MRNLEQERWDPGGRWEVDEARVMITMDPPHDRDGHF